MNALLFQYEICNVSRGLSETANCANELFRGHSHCVIKNMRNMWNNKYWKNLIYLLNVAKILLLQNTFCKKY